MQVAPSGRYVSAAYGVELGNGVRAGHCYGRVTLGLDMDQIYANVFGSFTVF